MEFQTYSVRTSFLLFYTFKLLEALLIKNTPMYLQETQDTSKYVDSPALMGWPALVYKIKNKKND